MELPSTGVAAFIGFAVQAKLAQFESEGASALRTPSLLVFNPGDTMDRSLIGRGVLTTPSFVGPFCRSVGAQSAAQRWHTDPINLSD